MDRKRPVGREKNVTGSGSVHKRGSGTGHGPVGSGLGPGGSGGGRSGGGPTRGPVSLIVILLVALLGGSGGISALLGGGDSLSGTSSSYQQTGQTQTQTQSQSSAYGDYASYYDMITSGQQASAATQAETDTETADTTVASGARDKFVKLKGNGKDTATVMVYLCGTDLESNSAMATKDLQEMVAADVGGNVNVLVYSGGCSRWQNSAMSSSVNQIWQVVSGGVKCLEKDLGSKAMTDPATLTSFIRYCSTNYKADRNILILWDHGGGSVSGYGYDQKYPRSGAMSLAGINTALKDSGLKFDFIGFDACLMATAENARMLSSYADYMIASEETEPGIGWYYTNWLRAFCRNSSMPTLDIGRQIVDDFVDTCSRQCRGQATTLSVVDLAELAGTMDEPFAAFAASTKNMITGDQYAQVSKARSASREFAASTRIDQIDLVHFAKNMGTQEGKDLADALLSAIKYNKTCASMTNAYGLSVYFPYRKTSSVDSAIRTYSAIGLDDSYSECIREFAGLEVSGQISAGGTGSPYQSLFEGYSGTSSSQSADAITQLLGAFLTGGGSSIYGLDSSNTGFFTGRSLSDEATAAYIEKNQFDTLYLGWTKKNGLDVISMPQEQWDLVEDLELSMYADDGEGYLDLGMDNVYAWDEEGNLSGDLDKTWLALDGQVVPYYHLDTVGTQEDYTITGYVPAELNGQRVRLILVFDDENPHGYVAGAQTDYQAGETDTVIKGLTEIQDGDQIEYFADYYTYDGEYIDNYSLGEPVTVDGEMTVSDLALNNSVKAMYVFTDIYDRQYWTEPVPGLE